MENGRGDVLVAYNPKRLQITTGCWQLPVPALTAFTSRPSWPGRRAGCLRGPSGAGLHATFGCLTPPTPARWQFAAPLWKLPASFSLFPVYTGSRSPSSWLWGAVMSWTVWIHPRVLRLRAEGDESGLCSLHLRRGRRFFS